MHRSLLSGFMATRDRKELDHVNFKVGSISVSPDAKRKTKDFVIKRAFSKLQKVTNMKQLQDEIHEGLNKLNELDCFENVKVMIDYKDDSHSELDVVLTPKEIKNRRRYELSATVDPKQKNVEIGGNVQLVNAFGYAERITVNGVVNPTFRLPVPLSGYKTDTSIMLPQIFNGYGSLYSSLSLLKSSSITKTLKEKKSGFTTIAALNNKHSLEFTMENRQLYTVLEDEEKKESEIPAVANYHDAAKPTKKISITHSMNLLDNLDEPYHPTKGSKLDLKHSIAGFGGDASFYKSEFYYQFYWPLKKFIASTQFSIGAIVPGSVIDSKYPSVINISDRFFERVRGFNSFVGDKNQNNEPVGGNFKSTFMGRLSYPISDGSILHEILMPHFYLFFNAGNVSNYDFHKSSRKYDDKFFKKFFESMAMSYGIGVYAAIGDVKLEANYSIPFKNETEDFSKFSFNISGSF